MAKIAIVGNLAGGGYMIERTLARNKVSTRIFISNRETGIAFPAWEGLSSEDVSLDIVRYGIDKWKEKNYFQGRMSIIQHELSCLFKLPKLLWADIICSYSSSLFDARSWEYIFTHYRIRPYIAFAAGSDIREVAMQDKGKYGERMRLFFRSAQKTLLLNLDMVKLIEYLKLDNAEFFPFPINTSKYAPTLISRRMCPIDELLLFMPSNLDWGIVDNTSGRNSTKGNDRLIKAFARYIKDGYKGHLILLYRGSDKDIAKKLVEELDIQKNVTFFSQMQKQELIEYYNMADVVADQFDIGAFGTTGLEAMSCAKPVMIYINNDCAAKCYLENPPVINVRSESEIYTALVRLTNIEYRSEIGKQARSWVVRFHDSQQVAERLKKICNEILVT